MFTKHRTPQWHYVHMTYRISSDSVHSMESKGKQVVDIQRGNGIVCFYPYYDIQHNYLYAPAAFYSQGNSWSLISVKRLS